MSPGFFQRIFQPGNNRKSVEHMIHEGTDKGHAIDRADEAASMAPTIAAEVAMIEEDRVAATSAAQSTQDLAPGSELAADAQAAAKRATSDLAVANEALADAQFAADDAHKAEKTLPLAGTALARQIVTGSPGGTAGTLPGGADPGDQVLARASMDLGNAEADLKRASEALADADAAKAQAEADAIAAAKQTPPAV